MFSQKLLTWYDQASRDLPWRTSPSNPYYVWLSEIMLQQTTVATVVPYFQDFTLKWPTLQDLAKASLDDILVAWQGLGYYSRARNLHRCAQSLAKTFPREEKELLKLPGIGPYTAAAITSIAFGKKAAAIDGNVVRVLSRYFMDPDLPPFKDLKEKLIGQLPDERCGDFTQALMELGALVCRPKSPLCEECPFLKDCKAYQRGRVEDYPHKVLKTKRPTRYAKAFLVRNQEGEILLRKRPLQGLLAGMMEVPTTPWKETTGKRHGPIVHHTFTHFYLEIEVSHLEDPAGLEGEWIHPSSFENYALPTVMKKVLSVGLKAFESA